MKSGMAQPSCSCPSGNFRALHAYFCWQALRRRQFHSSSKRYQKLLLKPRWRCGRLDSKLAWPEQHRESIRRCEEGETPDPTIQMTRVPLSKQSGLPLHLRHIDAVILEKGGKANDSVQETFLFEMFCFYLHYAVVEVCVVEPWNKMKTRNQMEKGNNSSCPDLWMVFFFTF